ncbi:transposase [Exiguobacterium sp. SL-9]|nr:transposase [Exiguobacterium sp. SL-9]
MRRLLKAYRTEIRPSDEQAVMIHKTIGTCRYVYNLYLQKNKEAYKADSSFLSGYDFSKWLNNEHARREEFAWIKEVPSKAVKQAIMNAETAYKKFFKKLASFPCFKRKSDYGSFYLIGTIHVKRHLIQLPKLGKVRLKEKGYIPSAGVRSATVSREGDRYFVSVLVEEQEACKKKSGPSEGIGIDMGIKMFLYTSDGEHVANVSRSNQLAKLTKSLKHQQRKLARRVKGSANFQKQKVIVQRLHRRIRNIKTDLKRKTVLKIVKKNPQFITIEHLHVKGMMKNRTLSNAFQQIGIGYFTDWLKVKCAECEIELRRVDRFYPSSQICSCCGERKKMLLHVRTYDCEHCGMSLDRDWNASINLKNAKDYTVLV